MEFALKVEKRAEAAGAPAPSEAGDIIIQVNGVARVTIVLPWSACGDAERWAALLAGRQPSPPLSGIELSADGHMIAFSAGDPGVGRSLTGPEAAVPPAPRPAFRGAAIELPRLLIAPKLREVMRLEN